MLLFMFLFLPAILTGCCFYYKNSKIVPSVFIGLMSAVLLCAFKTMFLYAHRIVPYTIPENIFYLLIRQTLLPTLVLLTVFFVFSRDSFEFKGFSILPLLLSFYVIYLPYSIVTTSEGLYSAYSLFVKPVIFFFMILQTSWCTRKTLTKITEKKFGFIVLYVFIGLVYLIIPALIESYVIIGENLLLQILLSVFYCLISAGICSMEFIKKLA